MSEISSLPVSSTAIAARSLEETHKAPQNVPLGVAKMPINADAALLVDRLDGQVSSSLGRAVETFNGMTARQREERLYGTAGFTPADAQAFSYVVATSLSLELGGNVDDHVQAFNDDPGGARLRFDPSKWDRVVAVLLEAIAAMNVARQTGAELQGKFALMAREAAVAQGVATMDAGRSAMFAALGTAAVGAGMAIGGGAVSIKGHVDNHSNIKSNLGPKQKLEGEVTGLKADLAQRQPQMGSGPDRVQLDAGGERGVRDVNLIDHKNTLHADELSVLEGGIRDKSAQAAALQHRSDLNQGKINKELTVGQSLSSLGMILGQAVGGTVMLGRFAAEERGILHDGDKSVHKTLADGEVQVSSEDTAAINKLLEAVAALLRQRADMIGQIASVRA